jgi:hypothetical protein
MSDKKTAVAVLASNSAQGPTAGRRAVVCFVEDRPGLVQQALWLRRSWVFAASADTDLVMFGPPDALDQLPDDVVKIVQRPVADEPQWQDYRFVNSLACLNAAGSDALDRYSHLLRTDVDTFLTPAWNEFRPLGFTCGHGGYSNTDIVRRRIEAISAGRGLTYPGLRNVGSTWYGPTKLVREASALAETLTLHILKEHFASGPGVWPCWYRGVASMYAGEIAVNHCAPEAIKTDLLDVPSTSPLPIEHVPHIHCWHTSEKFSKFVFADCGYTVADFVGLDRRLVPDYCLATAQLSLADRFHAKRGWRGGRGYVGVRKSKERKVSF